MKFSLSSTQCLVWLGVLLPCALTLFFWLASAVPSAMVANPAYDCLFYVTRYNEGASYRLEMQTVNQQLEMRAYQHGKDAPSSQRQVLYRFYAKTGSFQPVAIPFSATDGLKTGESRRLSLPELEKLKLDVSNPAPDGYRFVADGQYDGDWVGGLFFSGSRYHPPSIVKNGRTIRLPEDAGTHNIHFLGWIIAD